MVNAGGGTSPVSGCIPFWDEYGQERSQLKRVSISGFLGPGIGIYTSNAQNGGPFEDLQMTSGPTAAVQGTTCVEIGGTGVGGSPIMRGIRGLTCTNFTLAGTNLLGIGVDINTQNLSLTDAHFEDNYFGVEIGDFSSARGISLSNISGGNGMGGTVNGTVVDISQTCASSSTACGSYGTSDITVSNVFQSTASNNFKDNITGNMPTESNLGFYSLGDGNGTGVGTRPVVTTSSTIGSSPNLKGMTVGVPTSGVQGTTGTLVQMSTGTVAGGDLAKFDGNGNTVDSNTSSGPYNIPWYTTPNTQTGTTVAIPTNNSAVYGFVLGYPVTTCQVSYFASRAGVSGDKYDIGLFNSGGLVAHIGATPGNTFATGAAVFTQPWSGDSCTVPTYTTLQPGKYYLALTTNCSATCVALASGGNLISVTFYSNTSFGTTTGGNLTSLSWATPTDAYTNTTVPSAQVH